MQFRQPRWLDEIVNTYSSEGHVAEFFDRPEDTRALEMAGFTVESYEVVHTPGPNPTGRLPLISAVPCFAWIWHPMSGYGRG